ncbi:MAG: winged helix-turn-helix domain-containing protein [Terracidiphilus sp.]
MSLERPISSIITFGVFRLDVARGELKRFDTHLRLAPQPFKLLVLLVSRPGEIVTREEIQQQLWGTEIYVDFERGLNHCIRQIRAVLGDDPGAPTYIETVPRAGYRFVAPVMVVSPTAQGDSPQTLSQPAGGNAKPGARHLWRPIVLAAAAVLLVCIGLLVAFHRGRQTRPPDPPPGRWWRCCPSKISPAIPPRNT